MQLKITGDFIEKTAEKYGSDFKGAYAYSQSLFLMKTYIVLANADEIIVADLGLSGEVKSDMRYKYAQLGSFALKDALVSATAVIKPNNDKKIKLTIPKKTIGITEYQSRLIELLKSKVK